MTLSATWKDTSLDLLHRAAEMGKSHGSDFRPTLLLKEGSFATAHQCTIDKKMNRSWLPRPLHQTTVAKALVAERLNMRDA